MSKLISPSNEASSSDSEVDLSGATSESGLRDSDSDAESKEQVEELLIVEEHKDVNEEASSFFLHQCYLHLNYCYESAVDDSGRAFQPLWLEMHSLMVEVLSNQTDEIISSRNSQFGLTTFPLVFRLDSFVHGLRGNQRPVELFFFRAALDLLSPAMRLAHSIWLEHLQLHTDVEVHAFEIDDQQFWNKYREKLPSVVLISCGVETRKPRVQNEKDASNLSWEDAQLCCSDGISVRLCHFFEYLSFSLLLGQEAVKIFRTGEASVHRSSVKAFSIRLTPFLNRRQVHQRIENVLISLRQTITQRRGLQLAERTGSHLETLIRSLLQHLINSCKQSSELREKQISSRLGIIATALAVIAVEPTNFNVLAAQALLVQAILLEEGSVEEQNRSLRSNLSTRAPPHPALEYAFTTMAMVTPLVIAILSSMIYAPICVADSSFLNLFNDRVYEQLIELDAALPLFIAKRLTPSQQILFGVIWSAITRGTTGTTTGDPSAHLALLTRFESLPDNPTTTPLPQLVRLTPPSDLELLELTPSLRAFHQGLHMMVSTSSSSSTSYSLLPSSSSSVHAVFHETRHWHSGKQLDDGLTLNSDQRRDRLASQSNKFAQRNKQRSAAWIKQYSQSLDIKGRLNARDIVEQRDDIERGSPQSVSVGLSHTPTPTAVSPHEVPVKVKKGKPGSGQGGKTKFQLKSEKPSIEPAPRQSGKALKLIEDNKARASELALASMKTTIAQLPLGRSLLSTINELSEKLAPLPIEPVTLVGLVALLEWRLVAWVDDCKNSRSNSSSGSTSNIIPAVGLSFSSRYHQAALIFQLLNDILRRFLPFPGLVSAQHMAVIYRAFACLGYQQAYEEYEKKWVQLQGAVPVQMPKRKACGDSSTHIPLPLSDFQLLYCGQFMLRNMASARDPRVTAFYPDAWQRRLLDIVDARESALVIGPTSAGKTMISMYAIDAIHSRNKKKKALSSTFLPEILVYVSPTKALVNQVSAEVFLRTGQKPEIFTREQRPETVNYEVLVTVPQCMEILLLSPLRAEWCSRISYVIFDEVHCLDMGADGDGGGAVWERIIMLITCPFIANSATIGSPHAFHQWMQKVQGDRKVHLIQDQPATASEVTEPNLKKQIGGSGKLQTSPNSVHHFRLLRWAHLVPFIYVPTQPSTPVSPTNASSSATRGSLISLHPAACFHLDSPLLAFGVDAGSTVTDFHQPWSLPTSLSALTFSARDCMELFQQLTQVMSQHRKEINQLTANSQQYLQVAHLHWNQLEVLLSSLTPSSRFGDRCLTRLSVLEWEELIKQLWCKLHQFAAQSIRAATAAFDVAQETGINSNSNAMAAAAIAVFNRLSTSLKSITSGSVLGVDPAFDSSVLLSLKRDHRGGHIDSLLNVLLQLRNEDALPAIVFCMDREGCTRTVLSITELLITREREARANEGTDVAWERKRQAHLLTIEQVKHYQGLIEELMKLNGGDGGLQAQELRQRIEQHNDVNRSPDIDPRFTFNTSAADAFPIRVELSKSRFHRDFWVNRLVWKGGPAWSSMEHPLLLGLERGIAVHHGGMPKAYLDLVEVLFRQRKLRVVIATGTLAMGINMPCRSSVFFCDSPYITPVSFRQMSGRAGRRGFDVEGRIVFVGLPILKVKRLLASPLYALHGHMHFTPTTVLKILITLHHEAATERQVTIEKARKMHIIQTLKLMLQHPLTDRSDSSENLGSNLSTSARHYRVSLDLLYRLGLIDKDTTPIGLSGVVTHLHYHEPANLAFVYLLQSGSISTALHEAFEQGGMEVAGQRFISIMAHLFNQQLLPGWVTRKHFAQAPNSIVLLPPLETLSVDVAVSLKNYNQLVITTFADFSQLEFSLSARSRGPIHSTLPLASSRLSQSTTHNQSALEPRVMPPEISVLPISSNMAQILKGYEHGSQKDTRGAPSLFSSSSSIASASSSPSASSCYPSVASLLFSLPSNTFDSTAIPVLSACDPHGRPFQLNAYAYDFYQHGIYSALIKANQIADSQCYHLLDDWYSLLRKIHQSLLDLSLDCNSITIQVTDHVQRRFGNYLEKYKRYQSKY